MPLPEEYYEDSGKAYKERLEIDCRDCEFCANDPDGLYCAHETSQNKENIFGVSISAARRIHKFCGPAALLFRKASLEVLQHRGRLS